MLNTLRRLVNCFRPKTQIHSDQSKSSHGIKKETEQIEHREKLIHVRNHMDELTTTNAFDINSIRQKVHEELRASDLSARQKDRASMNKWFNKCDLTDSGSFDITAFQRRMEELARAEEEVFMEALPPQEDILMAFGKPEHDFFESEKVSLSGVFLRVNPNEDFDEEYSTPLLPMYHGNDDLISVEQDNGENRPDIDLKNIIDETCEQCAAVCHSQIADAQPAKSRFKSHAKAVSAPSSRYWTDSDRLTRFGRRKTSASCSSTRISSLTQIA